MQMYRIGVSPYFNDPIKHMSEDEEERLVTALQEWKVMFLGNGCQVSKVGKGPPGEDEPSRVAYLKDSFPGAYAALYNCSLDQFVIALPIP